MDPSPLYIMKQLSELPSDIDALFEKGHQPSEERLGELAGRIATAIGRGLIRNLEEGEERLTLRMSNIGKPARQLWYEAQQTNGRRSLDGTTLRKFLMGDIWEELLLWLAEEAGHTVEKRQEEVEVNGIKGHIDAVIDDVVVDVKSASRFAFEKFRKGTLPDNDSFGYYEQLAGYSKALDKDGAWLAVNKDTAELAILEAPKDELEVLDIPSRIDYLRNALGSKDVPDRCYDPVPDGQSGNMVLANDCTYCPFKFDCWKDANGGAGLRVFDYSNKPKYFTHVEKEPRVLETFPIRE